MRKEQTMNDLDEIKVMSHKQLAQQRIVLIREEIGGETANRVLATLTHLSLQDPVEPITMVIDSPGGNMFHGWRMIDQIGVLKAPVHSVATGLCASMAIPLFLAGEKRKATRHMETFFHFASTSVTIEIDPVTIGVGEVAIAEANRTFSDYRAFVVERTNIKPAQLTTLIERGHRLKEYISSKEAKKLGIISGYQKEPLF